MLILMTESGYAHLICLDLSQIRENNAFGQQIGERLCGQTIPDTINATGRLWIKFRSDDSIRGRGFRASYTTGRRVGGGGADYH